MKPMNILITADANYAPPVKTLLHSLFVNNPGERFVIFLMHTDFSNPSLTMLEGYCALHESSFEPVRMSRGIFSDAPVRSYYSEAMYYRLLAPEFLPPDTDRILYLDPDTLVINPIRQLYDLDMEGHLFAAASHAGLTNIIRFVNAIRLGVKLPTAYFNSGVLLLDMERLRRETDSKTVHECIRQNRTKLLLPDQDILNMLFADRILLVDETVYNYDARHYETYFLASGGRINFEWVLGNTVVLHYCGSDKPWHTASRGRFSDIYKQYMHRAWPPVPHPVHEPVQTYASDGGKTPSRLGSVPPASAATPRSTGN